MTPDTRPARGVMETFVVRVRVHQPDGEARPAGFVQHVRSGRETRFSCAKELLAALREPHPGQEAR